MGLEYAHLTLGSTRDRMGILIWKVEMLRHNMGILEDSEIGPAIPEVNHSHTYSFHRDKMRFDQNTHADIYVICEYVYIYIYIPT